MASVGAVYMARLCISRLAIELYVLAGSALALWQFTWVHRVFSNWAHVGLSGTGTYLSYAFLHTHVATQLALLVAVAAALAFIVDTGRALFAPRYTLI